LRDYLEGWNKGFILQNADETKKNVSNLIHLWQSIAERNPGIHEGTTAMATKTSLENKPLGNGDYFAITTSSSHPLFLTEDASNGLANAPLKEI